MQCGSWLGDAVLGFCLPVFVVNGVSLRLDLDSGNLDVVVKANASVCVSTQANASVCVNTQCDVITNLDYGYN